ncbi:MAG: hypothetical protein CMN54_07360 [SAR324 cluster bacterium]|uniref:Uncharacterized protein n=1 Tax=SAR324 cluster bacterium TaxID=2024889 RepID=A0A2D6YJ76_9DELT|nr:hypothetical protein [SAR324 cluster bacterium]
MEVKVNHLNSSSDLRENIVMREWDLKWSKWVEESADVIHTVKIDFCWQPKWTGQWLCQNNNTSPWNW